MMMSQALLPVVVNRTGGTAAALGERLGPAIRESFAAAGLPVALHLVAGDDLESLLGDLAGAPLVVVGGGDGTLGKAAGLLAAGGSAMAILPLGTRNHMARQLGIPADLAEAARLVATGRRQRIDLGFAGGRTFVNNISLGLYTRLVRNREAIAAPRPLANLLAACHVLRHLRSHPLQLTVDGATQALKTPLLLVGNNRYSLEAGRVGARGSLSRGELSFYAVSAHRPLQLVAMAVRTLVGRADPQRDFSALSLGRQAMIAGPPVLDVAFDGEVRRMALPLRIAIRPRALAVVVP